MSSESVPLFGYPGPMFYIIHIVAITSCSISALSSASVISFLFIVEKKSLKRNFYRWSRGERLVIYIAICDLAFSVTHTLDHAYILAAKAHPGDILCQFFAFLVIHTFTGQWFVIFYSALGAFIQVTILCLILLNTYFFY